MSPTWRIPTSTARGHRKPRWPIARRWAGPPHSHPPPEKYPEKPSRDNPGRPPHPSYSPTASSPSPNATSTTAATQPSTRTPPPRERSPDCCCANPAPKLRPVHLGGYRAHPVKDLLSLSRGSHRNQDRNPPLRGKQD